MKFLGKEVNAEKLLAEIEFVLKTAQLHEAVCQTEIPYQQILAMWKISSMNCYPKRTLNNGL